MKKLSHFLLSLLVIFGSLSLPGEALAATYDRVVVGDMGGFPPNTASAADLGAYIGCLLGSIVCPPGCDMGGFPPNTCNPGDLGTSMNYLLGNTLAFNPATGYVNFTTDPANPAMGDGAYGVIIDNVTTASSGPSGLDNVRGQLAIQAAIIADTTGGSWLGAPPTAIVGSGNGLQATASQRAQGTSAVDLVCNGNGEVTIRFFTQSYKTSLASGELCGGGVPCTEGEHWDQHDIIATCGSGDCFAVCGDGVRCDNNPDWEECDPGFPQSDHCCDPVTCTWTSALAADPQGVCSTAGVCEIDTCDGAGGCMAAPAADETPCGAPTDDCDAEDTCLSGVCVNNGPLPLGTTCRVSSGECDTEEICDGIGTLCPSDQWKADGLACGDPSSDECDHADICLSGSCYPNSEPLGTPCGLGLLEPTCDPDQCDGAGSCLDLLWTQDSTVCADNGGDVCCAGLCTMGACGNDDISIAVRTGTSPGYAEDYNNGLTEGPGGPTEVFTILPNDPAAPGHGTDMIVFDIDILGGPLTVGDTVLCTLGGASATHNCGPGDSACVGWRAHPQLTGGGLDTIDQECINLGSSGIGASAVAPDELDTGVGVIIQCNLNGGVASTSAISINMGFAGARDQAVPAGTTSVDVDFFSYCSSGSDGAGGSEFCGANYGGAPLSANRGIQLMDLYFHYDPVVFDLGVTGEIRPPMSGRDSANPYLQPAPGCNGNCNPVDALFACTDVSPGLGRFTGWVIPCNGTIMLYGGGCQLSASIAPPVGTVTEVDVTVTNTDGTVIISDMTANAIRGIDLLTMTPTPTTNVTGTIIWN